MTTRFEFPRNLIPLFCSALLLLIPGFVFGQITNVTDDQSTPIPGAGHDYIKMVNETVDPANGSVSIRIGVPEPQGRGLSLPFAFAYDSNGAMHAVATTTGTGSWMSNTGFGYGGWSNTLPMLSWSYRVNNPNGPNRCDYVTDFVFQDPTGGRHFFGMAAMINLDGGCTLAPVGTLLAADDDFYYAVATPSANLVLVADIVTGTAYSFAVSPQAGYAVAYSVEDRNGNQATLSAGPSSTTVTDTLGRTLTVGTGSTQSVQVPGLADYEVYWTAGVGTHPTVGQTADASNSNDPYCGTNPPIVAYGYGSTGVQVVDHITLPNGEKYQFSYDPTTGLLSEITYPDGGWVKYTWGWNTRADHIYLYDTKGNEGACGWTYDVPAVTERQVSFNGSSVALNQTFSYTTNFSGSPYKTTSVTSNDEIAGTTTVTQYAYTPFSVPVGPDDGLNLEGVVPVESSITYKDGNNTVYRVVNKSWSDQAMMTCASTTQGGIISRTDYNPGAVWPWTNKNEWDWGQAPACGSNSSGTPLLQTQVSTQSFPVQVYPASYFSPYSVPHFSRPTTVTTSYNGAQAAKTTYVYDGGSLSSGGTTVGRDSNYNSGGSITARGNATSKSEWVNTTGGSLTWSYSYDDTGQELTMSDPKSNPTNYSYADAFPACGSPPGSTDAYLTKITDAKGFTQSFTYRYCDGQLNSSTDRNSQITSYSYSDSLNRLTGISYPGTGSTAYGYGSDACGTPSTTSILLSGSTYYTETATLDGVCHVTETAITSDPSGSDYTATTFDGLGQVWKVSNPYRSASDPSYGVTTTTYDPLGRLTLVAYPDGSTTSTSYSASGNTYCSTVTDPAPSTRILCSNALGQLMQVTEGGLYSTSYSYDAFHFYVTQGSSQTRTFTYDSLSRLASAVNPESGTTIYTYPTSNTGPCSGDPSDVCTRTDARSITSTYAYDGLNRLTSKTYSDTTPARYYYYDETSVNLGGNAYPVTNTLGRLSHTTAANGYAGTIHSYDVMGRTTSLWECQSMYPDCWYMIGPATWNYDQAGDLTSYVTPYGITITQTITGAQRVSAITSSVSDATHPPVLAQNLTYTPWGRLSGLENGCTGTGCTPYQEIWNFNNRMQPVEIQVGTAANPSSLTCLVYNYYPGVSNPTSCALPAQAATGNNGNVVGIYDQDNYWTSNTHTEAYAYDQLNRLATAVATGSGSTYNLTFGTDRYGNMTCQTNGSTQGLCPNWTFDTTTNRINSSAFSYDAAGDLTNDGTHTYQWDAEGQMTAVDGGTTASYEYDALGRRVYANIEGGNEFWYFYDPAGNLVADWVPGGLGIDELMEPVAGRVLASYQNDRSDVFLKHQNALGSWGLITRPDGVVAQDEIYYPWGQQWAGIYVVESNFARMGWHDVESDLDWTPARRYESSLGRWLSPDPAGLDAADPSDPQTWNMYAYVRNNPTTFTDPDGQEMNCTQDQNGNLHCTVTDPSEDDFPKAMMELGGIAIPQEELGPWMPLVGAGLFAAGWCMQTHCVTNLTSLLSQEKKSPPPPTPATPAVSNTASPNPDPNQQKYNPNDKKKADNLIRGRLKSSRSYSSEYGNKTYGEIKELAKQGDMKAQAMKKLIEQSERLMEKVGNK